MKPSRRQSRAAAMATVAAAAGVIVPACAENESTLFIRACVVPDAETCTAEAGDSVVTQSRGLLDVKFGTSGYRCQLLLGNQLVSVGDENSLRTETSRVVIYAIDVTIDDAASGSTLASYTVSADGFIEPAQGTSPGYGLVDALLLDIQTASSVVGSNTGGAFSPEVLVSVVARGRTLGGTELESGVWQYPITVCNDCTCMDKSCASGMGATGELTKDCLFGRDGHCRFVDTECF